MSRRQSLYRGERLLRRQTYLPKDLNDRQHLGTRRGGIAGVHRGDDRIQQAPAADILRLPSQSLEERAELTARDTGLTRWREAGRDQLLMLLQDLLRALAQCRHGGQQAEHFVPLLLPQRL